MMTKPSGPLCNLDCTYCFYLEKTRLYPETTDWGMRDDVLESFVRQHIEAHGDHPVVSFAWQGGEPTLRGLAFFERVIALQQQYAGGRTIENAIQTNGILLDDAWCAFLAEHRFLVGLSIDGPEELHDRYRVDRGGQPTFRAVISALDRLKAHDVAFNTLTVVHRGNVEHPLDVYRFLRDIGSGYIQFIPVVERAAERRSGETLSLLSPDDEARAQVTAWSVDPDLYGAFLVAVFDEWVRRDVGTVFVQHFDVALEAWSGREASLCVFRPTCGDALALEHNGDVYSCDHFVYPRNRLGNLMNESLGAMVESPAQRAFGDAKLEHLPSECRQCDVRFACHGECPKHRFVASSDGSRNLNYLCRAYKRFFRHIDRPMQFMAGELARRRPPANVMAWTLAADRAAAVKAAGRNEPCPCGSGRKFKRCCGGG
jgi:uncharacterized protein